jgi:hypothetical protein
MFKITEQPHTEQQLGKNRLNKPEKKQMERKS